MNYKKCIVIHIIWLIFDKMIMLWFEQMKTNMTAWETRNCSKLRKIHSGQGHTSLPNDFSSKFKYVKPFFFLSFIFKSTDRYKIFHMTHSWQLCCCSMRQICCGLMIRNQITTKLNSITFHMWLKIACELGPMPGPMSLRQPNSRKVDQLWKEKYA